jgi:hypothetical protein
MRRFPALLPTGFLIACLLSIIVPSHGNPPSSVTRMDVRMPDDSIWRGDTLIIRKKVSDSLFDLSGNYIPMVWFARVFQYYDTARWVYYDVGAIALHPASGAEITRIRWDAFSEKDYKFKSDLVPVYWQPDAYLDTIRTIDFSVQPGDTLLFSIESRFDLQQPHDGPIIPDDFLFRTDIMCSTGDTVIVALDTFRVSQSDSLIHFINALADRITKIDSIPLTSNGSAGIWIVPEDIVATERDVYLQVTPEFLGEFSRNGMVVQYSKIPIIPSYPAAENAWPLDSICARMERGNLDWLVWDVDSVFLSKLLSMPKEGIDPDIRNLIRNSILISVIPTVVGSDGAIIASVPDEGVIDLLVTDLLGRVKLEYNDVRIIAGRNVIPFHAGEMLSGLHTVWLIYNKSVYKAHNFLVVK